MSEFVFFWQGDSPFSNFYPCSFQVDAITFNNSEQYFHYKKAELFGDTEIMENILKSTNPKQQKAFGRKVSNFDENRWNLACCNLMKLGLRAKNESLKKNLLETENKILAEASPFDKKWGIGLSDDDPNVTNQNCWKGANLLGKILMELRHDFLTVEIVP